MLAGGIAVGDREQVRRTASALLGWTLLVLTPLARAGRPARRADRPAAARRRRRARRGRRWPPGSCSSSPRRWCSTASASCSPACCRRTAGSPARRWRRCCPASSWPRAYLALRRHRTAAGTSPTCPRPAELVLGVGTTLGVVVLQPEPARRRCAGCGWACGRRCGSRSGPRRGCAGWRWPACSPWPGSSWWRRWRSGWPTTRARRHPGRLLRRPDAVPACRGRRSRCRWPPRPTRGCAERAEPATSAGLPAGAGPGRRPDRGGRGGRGGRAGGGRRARWRGCSWPRLRRRAVAALRDTIIAFAPGLVGYGLVALLTRALYARGLWKAPTVCVVGGWLLAVVADVVLARRCRPATGRWRSGAGHSIGVTVAGIGPAGRGRPRGRVRGAGRRRPERRARARWPARSARPPGCSAPGRWAPTRCPRRGPGRRRRRRGGRRRSCSWSPRRS